ncbi:hypothetical protein [Robertkochia aurantiaca]|uniref:hypothetical protein n=1 Tax=Robertkochia aurantiaca TaxID=2873700 RepID=UPI001CD04085|nr:hypothetical protein [Robertkochia sp. 3YJGBD-33]
MTYRDFFRIIIRLFALYSLLITLFSFLPEVIGDIYDEAPASATLWVLLSLIFLFLLFYLLVRKSDTVIDLLGLDKGFDTKEFRTGTLKSRDIFSVALLVAGFLLFLGALPEFLYQTYLAIQPEKQPGTLEKLFSSATSKSSGTNLSYILTGFDVLGGLILIAFHRKFAEFLSRFS